MGKILDRHPAERVLVELGELNDPEAGLGSVEQPRERRAWLVVARENDEIRLVLRDHAIELKDMPQPRRPRVLVLRQMRAGNDPDDFISAAAAVADVLEQGRCFRELADEEQADGRGDLPQSECLPARARYEDG